MSDISTSAAASAPVTLEQTGRAADLLPIIIKNMILNIVTLSFYRFWAKTAVRQFLWRHTKFMDEGLEYTGTGVELLLGFLIVAFAILLPLAIANGFIQGALDPTGAAFGIFTLLSYLVVLFLIGQAVFRARRYRMSRTVWRGIRGAIDGSPHKFALYYLGYTLAAVFTLGWAYPWMRTRIFDRLMSQSLFGNRFFKVDISAKPLYRRFAVLWFGVLLVVLVPVLGLLIASVQSPAEIFDNTDFGPYFMLLVLVILPLFGIGLAWYRAAEFRLFAKSISFEGLVFGIELTLGGLLWLVVGNFLIMVATFGFGRPFTQLRIFRFVCTRLTLNGAIDVDAIRQSQLERPGIGEGLADAFDMGAV